MLIGERLPDPVVGEVRALRLGSDPAPDLEVLVAAMSPATLDLTALRATPDLMALRATLEKASRGIRARRGIRALLALRETRGPTRPFKVTQV